MKTYMSVIFILVYMTAWACIAVSFFVDGLDWLIIGLCLMILAHQFTTPTRNEKK